MYKANLIGTQYHREFHNDVLAVTWGPFLYKGVYQLAMDIQVCAECTIDRFQMFS